MRIAYMPAIAATLTRDDIPAAAQLRFRSVCSNAGGGWTTAATGHCCPGKQNRAKASGNSPWRDLRRGLSGILERRGEASTLRWMRYGSGL
jgi:hypothetical protein